MDAQGQLYDSDGFVYEPNEPEDFTAMTLEEKILCGYFSAKPYNRDAYPTNLMNIPNPKTIASMKS